MDKVRVIGAGLAGCEAAWQLSKRNVDVELCEMKPQKRSPAHTADGFAELVCSNSLRGDSLINAAGILKAELRLLDSFILGCADQTRVEAGGALAVDRQAFTDLVTRRITENPRISVTHGEVTEIDASMPLIIATGPLTSDALAMRIRDFLGGKQYLSFYDAAAPLFSRESIDMTYAFEGSRYGKGSDYINCPMEKDEYLAFVRQLAGATQAHLHGFEDSRVFEGCMPVEVMARRGEDTLRHGPMRPIGLRHPETGKGYYAVAQLRRDNAQGTVYNMVGFQTHLTFPEQKRVFSMIPALKNAQFLRYGVMHRNTYLDSPGLLNQNYRLIGAQSLYFAGQITGVEGYVESAASGFLAGLAMARAMRRLPPPDFPQLTAIGALGRYVSTGGTGDFQPMNINFGIIAPADDPKMGKRDRYKAVAERSLKWIEQNREDLLK